MPISIALAGFDAPGDLRRRIEAAARIGFRSVHLNAAEPGARPRDLSRSARRDLASLLRRHELTVSGVDLWLPPAHLTDPAAADRAAAALSDAALFASEMAALTSGRALLCCALPGEDAAGAVVRTVAERAHSAGTVLADHAWPSRWAVGGGSGVALGIDPAALILAGADPGAEAARAGPSLAGARLSDLDASGRVAPGRGRLDLLAYLAALSTVPRALPPALDLRSVASPERAAEETLALCGPDAARG